MPLSYQCVQSIVWLGRVLGQKSFSSERKVVVHFLVQLPAGSSLCSLWKPEGASPSPGLSDSLRVCPRPLLAWAHTLQVRNVFECSLWFSFLSLLFPPSGFLPVENTLSASLGELRAGSGLGVSWHSAPTATLVCPQRPVGRPHAS